MLLSMTPSSSSPFSSAVTCSSARDLVAAAPFLLGYTVTNSVVVILLSRKRSRGAFRIAIPEPTSAKSKPASSGSQDAVYKEVAQTLAGMVRELRDIDQIALLYYTAQAITTPDTLPGTDLIKVCQAEVSAPVAKLLKQSASLRHRGRAITLMVQHRWVGIHLQRCATLT